MHGDVFLPVRGKADRRGARHVVQADLPERRAGGGVVRAEHPVERSGEHQAARRRERARRQRRALALDPDCLSVSRLSACRRPYLPSLSGRGRTVQRTPVDRLPRSPSGTGTRSMHASVIGTYRILVAGSYDGRHPAAAAAHVRANHLRLPVSGHEARIDDLLAGLRIDRRDDVLQPEVDRRQVLAGLRVDDVEDHLLAGGHHDALHVAVHRQLHHLPFERPVEIPLAVRLMLKMPGELAGVGIQASVESR